MKPVELPNLDLFDEFAAAILSHLFESFPLRVPLCPLQLTGDHYPDPEAPDPIADPDSDEGRRLRRFEAAIATITWLRDEGYLVAPWHGRYRFRGCVLTAKGLRALLQLPDRLKADKTLGERLVAIDRDPHSWIGPETVRVALGLGS